MNERYDAVIVLGMNIKPSGEGFAPTTYEDHDEFGMLAGVMNVIAAVELWANETTTCFVFSTGSSAKTKAAFGNDVPTEAQVYSEDFAFRKQLRRAEVPRLEHIPEPTIILEERSVNTFTNLVEVLQIVRDRQWRKVAIMSARYHIPRVEALYDMIQAKQQIAGASVDFIMCEDVITESLPGVYDAKIAEAYASAQCQKREAIEAQGLQAMRDGTYVIGEFQLTPQLTPATV